MAQNISNPNWGRFTIARKLALIPVLFILVFAGTLFFTIHGIHSARTDSLVSDIAGRQRALVQSEVADVLLISQGEADQATLEYTRDIFDESLEALINGGSVILVRGKEDRMILPPAPTSEIRSKLSEQKKLMNELQQISDEILKMPLSDPSRHQKIKALLDKQEQLHFIVREGALMFVRHSESEIDKMIRWEITLGIFTGLISILLLWWISRGIVRPLRQVVDRVNDIAEAAGDLTNTVPVVSNDELGDLAKAFNKMLAGLKTMVIEITGSAERLSSSSQQLSSSAQEMNATTQEVSSTVQQIAKGTENTARQVEETSKVMEQMSASVGQVAFSAQQTGGASAQANQAAQRGGEAAKEAVNKMAKIYETVTDSARVIQKLGERSEQINEIVNVITDIADQTNLLALNAAIEAARAGEAGRGFAVVADEVRKLAEGSGKAAEQISGLIKDIQKETNQAVKSMEIGSKEVTEGKDTIAKANAALEEIIKLVAMTAVRVEEISASAQQMASGTKQVVKSVGDIASNAEETASATEETSASSEEMTAAMEEMAASAQELSQMAVNLRELVGNFKVNGQVSGEKEKQRIVPPVKPAKVEKPFFTQERQGLKKKTG